MIKVSSNIHPEAQIPPGVVIGILSGNDDNA